ncbi:NACHT, LRR and PYD domains-containing protein 12-like [Chanos chanos]|uniref:NACHT, LRR and PYD domains-containing protein 12-like n=1 Tax=Chanos chanos TaxID=29144 RepID=A0A6J2VLB3_CHACN|nr:NACHT, LRR and PYD domains-containing protein 12-like [Chanos chanos]
MSDWLYYSPTCEERSDSPEPSCVSRRSDRSMENPVRFKEENFPAEHRYKTAFPDDVIKKHKSELKKKLECVGFPEALGKQRNPIPLNEIYTELYIVPGGSDVNNEHEIIQIETASRRVAIDDMSVKCNDIFKPLPGQDEPFRTVLTTGVAGIGKTVSVQKFVLDWAEGKANQDIHYIFPLPFRELNLKKDKKHSLIDLLSGFFKEVKEFDLSTNKHKILFILDGLDECRFHLDFQKNRKLGDVTKVTEPTTVDVLLTSLINGNLLPSALIWITSRPAAANQIPPGSIDQITEIRGFNDQQKEEYFRKRISNKNLANRIISHMKSVKSLYIMCHIPVFCWISATVLERMQIKNGQIPKTLTQMYTHFLIIQMSMKQEKYNEKKETNKKMIFKLGRLAFQQLMRGNLIFYEEDLRRCGIDVREASVYSGVCTQIFREESGLYQGRVYCFVHLSIQEHLAALYVYLSFITKNKNVLNKDVSSKLVAMMKHCTISHLLKTAVDKALQSKNGHLDLFLRFLLSLSRRYNQALLLHLSTHIGTSSQSHAEIIQYIKVKIRENPSPKKAINLLYCLNELNEHSLVEDVYKYLYSKKRSASNFPTSQWSALIRMLPASKEELDVFDLQKYGERLPVKAEDIFMLLPPVVRASRRADLRNSNFTEKSCEVLASVVISNSPILRELDLSYNKLQDSGVKLLSAGLKCPHSKLEVLRMRLCNITDKSCAALASALSSSSLRELDLSYNDLLNSGVKQLSSGLENPHCKLEILRLTKCSLTENSCAALALALSLDSSSLTELDLSINQLKDSGVKLLLAGLDNPQCKLKVLRLSSCDLTEDSCESLALALSSNASNLRELNLSDNKLQDSGVQLLLAEVKNPHCKLEILSLSNCDLTMESCAILASALSSNSSRLKELDLNDNNLQDSGLKKLLPELEIHQHKLEILRLSGCNLTKESCDVLASVLRTQRSNSSSLRELDLSYNKLQDSGVELLSSGLKSLHCKLETLRLKSCGVTVEGCAYLASALESNPSHLRELDLSLSSPGGSGQNPLLSLQENHPYKLEKLM